VGFESAVDARGRRENRRRRKMQKKKTVEVKWLMNRWSG
jgi:ribosome-associated protein YbcJ (S4-like RNA binding protein)